MPDEHAKKYQPSAAERWIHCTASPTLEEGMPDSSSVYAAEGTLAHHLAELKLRTEFDPLYPTLKEFDAVRKDELYSAEMERCTDDYFDFIAERAGEAQAVEIEQRLDLSGRAPGSFGTADCLIFDNGNLDVIDFKYGRHVEVSAEGNAQMLMYAIGAMDELGFIYDIDTVTLAIFQPRMNNVSLWKIWASDVARWAKTMLAPVIDEAEHGGVAKSGSWCGFCRAKGACREYLGGFDLTDVEFEEVRDPRLLAPDEAAGYLTRLDGVKSAYDALKEWALRQALASPGSIPGFKAVAGRSVRAWSSFEAALAAAETAGHARQEFFENRPLSLSSIEKDMGKKAFAQVFGDFVTKPPGKPTLVPAADKRPELTPGSGFDMEGVNFEN